MKILIHTLTLWAALIWVNNSQAQQVFTPRELRAIPVKPCEDKECVVTYWEKFADSSSHTWIEERKPQVVDKRFAVPLYIGVWPERPCTVLGYVYVLYRPATRDPRRSAVRAMTEMAKRHGAEAVSLRPRKILGHWYAAGTAVKWR